MGKTLVEYEKFLAMLVRNHWSGFADFLKKWKKIPKGKKWGEILSAIKAMQKERNGKLLAEAEKQVKKGWGYSSGKFEEEEYWNWCKNESLIYHLGRNDPAYRVHSIGDRRDVTYCAVHGCPLEYNNQTSVLGCPHFEEDECVAWLV